MHLVPWAAVTNYHYHKPGGLNKWNLFSHSSKGQKSGMRVSTGPCSLWETPRENSFLPLPASGGIPGCRWHHPKFCLVITGSSPFSVGLWDQISFSYKSFCLGAHSNPVWSHLDLTTSAKTLFPNKIMFTFKALGPQPIISKDIHLAHQNAQTLGLLLWGKSTIGLPSLLPFERWSKESYI